SEGSAVNLSATATDPAGPNDPLTYTWTITKPDGITLTTLAGGSVSFTPPDNGNYGVSLAVNDGDGGITTKATASPVDRWFRGEGNARYFTGGNSGVLNGGVSFVLGKIGQAFSFDGSTGYVRLPDNFLPYPAAGTSTTPLSFETWFRTSGGGVIMGQQGAS